MASITDFQAKGIVAGLASAPDAKPLPRYEIDDLMAKHPDTFNLFLLALERLQDENEGKKKNKWMSYFEVAGSTPIRFCECFKLAKVLRHSWAPHTSMGRRR